MKAILFLLIFTVETHAEKPVFKIYGDDNRKEVNAATRAEKALADSSAALIPNSYLIDKRSKILLDAPTLEQSELVCESERYREQPAASVCSGTLIAPDLILTAAHCYQAPAICEQATWVFGYHLSKNKKYEFHKKKDVYRCKKVVLHLFDLENGHDFAVVKLDRPVRNRIPVKLRDYGTPVVGSAIFIVGNPSGLPTKIADDAWITGIKNNILMTNLDAFSGNSGSGVYNSETGFLEGILSHGKEDYTENKELSCMNSQVYLMQDGGEAVMKIDPIRDFLKTYRPF